MTIACATNRAPAAPRTSRSTVAVALFASIALLLVVSGCSSTTVDYSPGELTAEQRARCREVAQAYVDGEEKYLTMRDELAGDPVALAWFVRYLEHEIVQQREGQVVVIGEETVAAEDVRPDPKAPTPWNLPGQRPDRRAIAQIVAIGEPAVGVVVQDLALSPQEFLRSIGIEILTGIGDPAVPALLELASTGQAQQQRVAARALGNIGARGPALAALRQLAKSPTWRIRSDAAQGLAKGGGDARDLLIEMLADEDPFVRRKAGESLGNYRDRTAANALVDFLESCKEDEDWTGELAAQKALRIMAKAKLPRSAVAWRRYANTLPDEVVENDGKEGGR